METVRGKVSRTHMREVKDVTVTKRERKEEKARIGVIFAKRKRGRKEGGRRKDKGEKEGEKERKRKKDFMTGHRPESRHRMGC